MVCSRHKLLRLATVSSEINLLCQEFTAFHAKWVSGATPSPQLATRGGRGGRGRGRGGKRGRGGSRSPNSIPATPPPTPAPTTPANWPAQANGQPRIVPSPLQTQMFPAPAPPPNTPLQPPFNFQPQPSAFSFGTNAPTIAPNVNPFTLGRGPLVIPAATTHLPQPQPFPTFGTLPPPHPIGFGPGFFPGGPLAGPGATNMVNGLPQISGSKVALVSPGI